MNIQSHDQQCNASLNNAIDERLKWYPMSPTNFSRGVLVPEMIGLIPKKCFVSPPFKFFSDIHTMWSDGKQLSLPIFPVF